MLRELGGQIADACAEAYFVGGCVRDLLLGEPLKDIDLAISGDTFAVGRILAREHRGHVFWLHQDEGVVRVVLPALEGLQIDLCPLRGTLEEDLRARDLTINAMAVAAREGLHPGVPVLDPLGGQADLAARVIRFCTPASPESDPLRTLRALRFRWKLDFRFAEDTEARMRASVPLLERVSVERVRDELFQLLAIARAHEALAECLRMGMGRWLFGREVGADVDAPPARVEKLLELQKEVPPEMRELLGTEPTPPRRRREVLLWAGALHSLQPAVNPAAAARYLALSNDEKQLICKGIEGAERLTELMARWPVAGRERYRLFRATGPAGPEAVLLHAAHAGWTPAHAELLREALDRTLRPQPPLLTGNEVIELLALKPGPRVGKLLTALEEERADGNLRSREEAVDWLLRQA